MNVGRSANSGDVLNEVEHIKAKIKELTPSFRDQCAIAAMAATIGTLNIDVVGDMVIRDIVAHNSFAIADRMEVERNKRTS